MAVTPSLICGEERAGTGVAWLTGWPTSSQAMVLFQKGREDVLFVEHYNHVPNAREIARDADVRWARREGAKAAAEELAHRGAKRVGVIGLLSWAKQRQLAAVLRARRPQRRVSLAADAQVRRGDRMDADRRRVQRPRPRLAHGKRRGRDDGARARRPRRGGLHQARRHHGDPLHRRHRDGKSVPLRAAATSFLAPPATGRRDIRRDQRHVLGLARPGAAHHHGRRAADAALPQPPRHRGGGVPRDHENPARRRHRARDRRGDRPHRGRRLFDLRRHRPRVSAAAIGRRCSAPRAALPVPFPIWRSKRT